MLLLLQRKLTRERQEFIKHIALVCVIHILILLMVSISFASKRQMVFDIKALKNSSNVIVTWRPSSRPAALQKSVSKVLNKESKKAVKKQLFTPVDFSKVKSKKTASSYRVPQPPVKNQKKMIKEKVVRPVAASEINKPAAKKITAKTGAIESHRIEEQEVTTEPLVLSVQDYIQEQYYLEIIESVRRWWQPPLGIDPQAQCIISIKISDSGACVEMVVKQSSGIPAYDISAKSALLKNNFPKSMWGKECIFQF